MVLISTGQPVLERKGGIAESVVEPWYCYEINTVGPKRDLKLPEGNELHAARPSSGHQRGGPSAGSLREVS